MKPSVGLREALGHRAQRRDLLHFSARLDETDTHDRSIYSVIGGAIATIEQWNRLEIAWQRLLTKSRVDSFHYKDFEGRQKAFAGWTNFQASRFLAGAQKAIQRNVEFRVAVGIDPRVHAEVKNRMKGITGFRADSDYGLCLRWLLFHSCETISRQIGEDFTMSVIVEDGPYANGAVALFHQLRKMTGGKRRAKHAAKYRDIAVLGKESLSLQAADAIVGIEAEYFGAGGANIKRNRLAVLLDKPMLERWYEGMIAEKTRRREYAAQKRAKPS
jgi:hypothetical protein